MLFMGTVRAQPVKRLYIANDDHTDYMWSGTEAQYDSAFLHMLDYQLGQIEASKNEPRITRPGTTAMAATGSALMKNTVQQASSTD